MYHLLNKNGGPCRPSAGEKLCLKSKRKALRVTVWLLARPTQRNHAPKNKSEAEEEKQPEQWFITGANGNLGQRLIRKLLSEGAMITAVVRSGRAERELTRVFSSTRQLRIEVIDYAETMLLSQAAYGAQYAVHLVGILKSSKHATYATAHEASCTSLSRALKDTSVEHITYLSILGAKPDSNNACLASKGE